jgi:hypothetical protein
VGGVAVEQLVGLRVTQKVHDLVLAFSRRAAVRVKHQQLAPLSSHQLHDLAAQFLAEVEQEGSAWRDGVGLENLASHYPYLFGELIEELNVLNARLESSISRLVDLGPGGDSVERDIEQFFGIGYSDQFEQVLDDSGDDLLLSERLHLVFEEAAAFLRGRTITLMHW